MNNEEMLGKERVGKLLFKLACPAILAQVINVLYNIVDRLYIARLNEEAIMSGMTICFPILMIVSAFSALVGMSGAPLASIELGKGNKDKAERIMNNSFVMLVAIAIILTIVVEIFQDSILNAFGATPSSLVYGKQYVTIYAAGTIFVLLSLGLNTFIATQGFSKTNMMSVVIGAVSNIILDPIFIFGFKMGIRGAALATIISQAFSAIWVVSFLLGKKTILKLRFKQMTPNTKIILSILALGISPFIMQSTESLVQMTFNNGFNKYSATQEEANIAIAGMGVLFTAMQMTSMPLIGLAQGGQPIISYNYGARNMDRVKKTFKLLLMSSSVFCGIMWALALGVPYIFAKPLAPSEAVLNFATYGLRIFMAGVLFMCFQFSCQQSLVALGQAKISLFLALFRKIIMLIPLAIVLPMLMTDKRLALLISEPIADVTAAIVTMITFVIVFRSLNKKVKASLEADARDEKCKDEKEDSISDTFAHNEQDNIDEKEQDNVDKLYDEDNQLPNGSTSSSDYEDNGDGVIK